VRILRGQQIIPLGSLPEPLPFQFVTRSVDLTEGKSKWQNLQSDLYESTPVILADTPKKEDVLFDFDEAMNFMDDVIAGLDRRRARAARAEADYWQFLDEADLDLD